MAKTNKNFLVQKQKLVVAIEAIFVEKGYENTRLEDILVTLDLSKGGFYHYFKSKEDVLIECMHLISDRLIQEAYLILNDSQLKAIEKLIKFIDIREAAFFKKGAILSAFKMIYDSELQREQLIKILGKAYVFPFSVLIEEGNREGVFDVSFPYETASLLIPAFLSVPNPIQSDSRSPEMIAYKKATFEMVIRTLNLKIENDLLETIRKNYC